jgi:hypothetical protein
LHIEDLRSELNRYDVYAGYEFAEELENQLVFDVRKYVSSEKNEKNERALFSMVNDFMTSLHLTRFDAFGHMRISAARYPSTRLAFTPRYCATSKTGKNTLMVVETLRITSLLSTTT